MASDHISLLVDEFYFSALFDDEEQFPISDEKYAMELHLQEALMSSATSSRVRIGLSTQLQISQNLNSSRKGKEKETGESSNSNQTDDWNSLCRICMDVKPIGEMFRSNTCSHLFCTDCIGKYIAAKLQENISMIECPEVNCKVALEPQFCRSIVPGEVFDRWENALCESVILASQKFYCPFKDCSAMLVDDGVNNVVEAECPNCHRMFCAQCKVPWHGGISCDEFRNLGVDFTFAMVVDKDIVTLMHAGEHSKSFKKPIMEEPTSKADETLFDDEEQFPISDEKYAEELQFQEALMSSSRVRIGSTEMKISDQNSNSSRKRKWKEKETGESSNSNQTDDEWNRLCGICMDVKPIGEMFGSNTCAHLFCTDCIGKYIAAKLQENISMIECPEVNCKAALEPQFCKSIVPRQVFDRWENALCESLILASQKFYCPFKDCSAKWLNPSVRIAIDCSVHNARSHGMVEFHAPSFKIWVRTKDQEKISCCGNLPGTKGGEDAPTVEFMSRKFMAAPTCYAGVDAALIIIIEDKALRSGTY
ncbi:Zinc finger, RING-type [Corchorus capsularis]|uniref:RBR-type E3 ubiquitin transferase n=1 Tax=Corchorus capsularis TaxID=210143 RepID=A0A1R3HJV9_COCAP|nr:Zinc finger, RING-type [Corchorus capsularis]